MKRLWQRLWPWLFPLGAAVGLSLLWGCPIRQLLGIGCPLCGISRAMLRALRLDLAGAFALHPLWPLVLLTPPLGVWLTEKKPKAVSPFCWTVFALLLLVYTLRLLSRDPVVFQSARLIGGAE